MLSFTHKGAWQFQYDKVLETFFKGICVLETVGVSAMEASLLTFCMRYRLGVLLGEDRKLLLVSFCCGSKHEGSSLSLLNAMSVTWLHSHKWVFLMLLSYTLHLGIQKKTQQKQNKNSSSKGSFMWVEWWRLAPHMHFWRSQQILPSVAQWLEHRPEH